MGSDPEDDDNTDVPVPLVVPLISAKILERPQVWGIFGDWRDLYSGDGAAHYDKYT